MQSKECSMHSKVNLASTTKSHQQNAEIKLKIIRKIKKPQMAVIPHRKKLSAGWWT